MPMKSAFSTVACPSWTLERVAEVASSLRYDGVELRTFGEGLSPLACEPAHTEPQKIRTLFEQAACRPMCLATSLRFDEPYRPPVIGRVLRDYERPVRQTHRTIDLAAAIGCPFVRVFAFETYGRESRKFAVRRITDRLRRAVDRCWNRQVRLLVENGGSFPTAESLAEIIEGADYRNLLNVAWSAPVAREAGESPERAFEVLGSKILSVKIKELRQGRHVPVGEGELGGQEVIERLRDIGFDGWLVYERDVLWAGGQDDPTPALERIPRLVVGAARHERAPSTPARTAAIAG